MTYMQKFKKDFLERYDVQIEQFKTVLGHLAMYIGEKSLSYVYVIQIIYYLGLLLDRSIDYYLPFSYRSHCLYSCWSMGKKVFGYVY